MGTVVCLFFLNLDHLFFFFQVWKKTDTHSLYPARWTVFVSYSDGVQFGSYVTFTFLSNGAFGRI